MNGQRSFYWHTTWRLCQIAIAAEAQTLLGWIREHLSHAWDIEHATLEPEVNGCGSTTLIASRKTHPKESRQ